MKKRLCTLLALVFVAGSTLLKAESGSPPLWLIEEDFIKFGKKELYESIRKSWLAGVDQTKWHMLALEDELDPEYIYLFPFEGFGALGKFLDWRLDYESQLQAEEKKRQQMLSSLLNFKVASLHEYLTDCSYFPSEDPVQKRPYAHYWVVGITPGNGPVFEQYLKELHQKENSPCVFLTWRVLFGADTPKYVIAMFSSSREAIESRSQEFDFSKSRVKDIVRSQKEGFATVRTDLSLHP